MKSALGLMCLLAGPLCAAEVTTLAGKKVAGDVVALSAKELKLKTAAGDTVIPVADLLLVSLANDDAVREAHTEVELADGSLLACKSLAIKGTQAELTLVGGAAVACPLANVATVLNNANDAAVKQEWRALLRKRGQYDMLVVRSEGKLDGLDGTFGPGSAAGDAIEFALASGDRTLNPKLARVQGLVFVRKPAADAPAVFCKLVDMAGNSYVTRGISIADGKATFETVGGAKAALLIARVARLDFSKGKVAYLSDLEPIEVDQTSTDDLVFPYRRDKNLAGGPLRMKNVAYAKGLALHARTALTYDIAGDFNEFRCVLGVDDVIRNEGGAPVHVLFNVEGDGRPLFKAEVRTRDEPKPIAVDVKNVRRLKITVASPLLDLGNQVNLGEARVTK